MSNSPAAESGGSACAVHHLNDGTEEYQEDEDTYVPCIRKAADETVYEYMLCSTYDVETGIEESSYEDTYEQ